jgi:TRAP-type mannitol/chloroaromatic compound transport system substrate-binding protein
MHRPINNITTLAAGKNLQREITKLITTPQNILMNCTNNTQNTHTESKSQTRDTQKIYIKRMDDNHKKPQGW